MSSEEDKQSLPVGAVSVDSDGLTAAPSTEASVSELGKTARAPKPAPAPVSPAVAVREDIDFDTVMRGAPREEDGGFEPGQKVSGRVEVISLHGQEVFLDLGGKATGYVLKEELKDAEGNLLVKVGDEIEGVVVGVNSSGVHVRTRVGQDADSHALREAFEAGIPVEGKVVATNKGGYEVQIGQSRAFCPHSQIDLIRIENPETVIGQTFTFKITEFAEGRLVVSRAQLLRAEQAERKAETLATIQVGARVKGRVRSIQKFGVFVDLGGVDGLIPMSELAWERVGDAHDVVQLGQELEVVVLEVDTEKDRIALSVKQTLGDPWVTGISGLAVGTVIAGTVARLTAFGAFVTIAPGVDGLVHVSDLAHQRVRHPGDVLKVGDRLQVKVMEVDLERRRVALSLKALLQDPWDDVSARYQPGQPVKGRVESVQAFGVFVELEPGVTALLPASESNTQGQELNVVFRVGAEVEGRILRVEQDAHKIAITRRDEADVEASQRRDRDRGDRPPRGGDDRGPRGPRRDDRGPRDGGGGRGRGGTLAYSDAGSDKGGLGSFGELLMKAMGKDTDDAGKGGR